MTFAAATDSSSRVSSSVLNLCLIENDLLLVARSLELLTVALLKLELVELDTVPLEFKLGLHRCGPLYHYRIQSVNYGAISLRLRKVSHC